MNFNQVIKYCPRCGSGEFPEKAPNFFRCVGCDFHFYVNNATAVCAIVPDDANRVLLIRRGRNPGKGKWSVPGGFVDAGESAEVALARELREEVNLELASLTYLCSHPNPYEYKGVVFPVVDLIFICQAHSLETLQTLRASEEVDGHAFLPLGEIDLDEVAFPSIRVGLERFRQSREPGLSL